MKAKVTIVAVLMVAVLVLVLAMQNAQVALAGLLVLGVTAFAATGFDFEQSAQLQGRVEALQLLQDLSGLLQISTSIDEACELLPVFGARLFPGSSGSIYLIGDEQTRLAASWGVPTAGSRCVPLYAHGHTFGVLALDRVRDEQNVVPFAEQVALALANLRRQETLQLRALRDPLTGLFNRRYVAEFLQRELRHDEPVAVAMIDVDHFKRYNDTFGHAGGDLLLQHVARAMQRVFREADVVCRYGGEEFLVVMPGATLDDVRAYAEILTSEVRRMHVQHDGEILGGATLSIGIAVSPHHGTAPETLIASADRAMYAAKSAGRDRIASPQPQAVGRDAA
ncbi:MAG TPA: GGDEF domain-containing protein [Thermoanaerobaculia bacterium]|jgi:diguanylate cyclase (GGDEF)-like protein